MARLSICLCVLVVLISVGACGKAAPQPTTTSGQPSLAVSVDLTVLLKSHRVTTINLLPSGHPSGVVALKTVHDGHLVTIGSQRFTKLDDPGYLTVEVTGRDVELGWNIPQGTQSATSSCGTAFPAGSTLAGASYGNETLDAGSGDVDVWDLTVDAGKTTTDGAGLSDASVASVAESTKFPTETAYCVTVALDRT